MNVRVFMSLLRGLLSAGLHMDTETHLEDGDKHNKSSYPNRPLKQQRQTDRRETTFKMHEKQLILKRTGNGALLRRSNETKAAVGQSFFQRHNEEQKKQISLPNYKKEYNSSFCVIKQEDIRIKLK